MNLAMAIHVKGVVKFFFTECSHVGSIERPRLVLYKGGISFDTGYKGVNQYHTTT